MNFLYNSNKDTNNFRIRRVVESDVAIGEGLIQAAFLDEFKAAYGHSLDIQVLKFVYSRSWKNGLVLVDSDGVICGAIGGVFSAQSPDTMTQTVWYLQKEVRRYAFALLNAFEKLSKDLGAKRVIVTCMGADRAQAKIRKFQSAGFRLTELKFCKEL